MTLYKVNACYVLFDNNEMPRCILFRNILEIYNAYKENKFSSFVPYSNWKFEKIMEFTDINVLKDKFPEEFI